MTRLHRPLAFLTLALILLAASACQGSAAASPSASESASRSAAPSESASAEATGTTEPLPSSVSTGPANVSGPATAIAGSRISVSWTGPNGPGDYVTIVPGNAIQWTNEAYYYTGSAPQGSGMLQTSIEDGAYALWYVQGTDDAILARVAIRILPWAGTLDGPASVKVNTQFDVSWTGPNGQGDYVTILPAGATGWTNENYFYTGSTSNGVGRLLSPLAAGNYQLAYIAGADDHRIMLSQPISVTP